MNRFIPHSVQLNTAGGVAAWINEILETTADENVSLFEEASGSETDREFVAAKDIAPTMPISTLDLSFLGTCGMLGIPIAPPGSGVEGLLAYGRELPLGALPTALATAHHLTCKVTDGLLVPVNASASHNQSARLALMLHAILGSAGTSGAAPMIFTASQAINSGAGATVNLYTTGVVHFNSRLVTGIMHIAVDFGIGVFKESTSGNVYPDFISIISRMPKIKFSTRDSELISEVGDGIAVTSFAAYFRQINQNGQRVAVATPTHISISGVAGMITPGAWSLKHKSPGESAFTITPSLNSSLLTISTTATIPTS